jgi:hypothetical protein
MRKGISQRSKRFVVSDGSIKTNAPELNSWFRRKKITDAIRAQLVATGLTEAQGRPDFAVIWELGALNGRVIFDTVRQKVHKGAAWCK